MSQRRNCKGVSGQWGKVGRAKTSRDVPDCKSSHHLLLNVVIYFATSASQTSCPSIINQLNIIMTRSVNFVAMRRKRPTSRQIVEQRAAFVTVSFGAAR